MPRCSRPKGEANTSSEPAFPPGTFWNELAPHNYSFASNVDPTSPGQDEETLIDTGEVRKTRPYNGYGEQVAHLYA